MDERIKRRGWSWMESREGGKEREGTGRKIGMGESGASEGREGEGWREEREVAAVWSGRPGRKSNWKGIKEYLLLDLQLLSANHD